MKIPRTKQEIHFVVGFVIVISAIILFLSFYDNSFHYLDHIDETIVTVDDNELILHDLGFYVLYEETLGNSMAITYDSEQPSSFWGKHTNGVFISSQARRSALDMMIHDEIFYEMALKEQVELSEDDLLLVEERFQDFLSPISTKQLDAVGMTEEELHDALEKIALSEKYMIQYADEHQIYYDDYNITGKSYQELLSNHTIEENTYLINKLNVGKISINQTENGEN